MLNLYKLITGITLCVLSTLILANTVPPNFPNPENVRIENGTLKWDAVDTAGGYNIYFDAGTDESAVPLTYIDTVKGATEYQLERNGTFSVVSFNQDASLFSNQFSPSVRVVFDDGITFEDPVQLFSVVCGNVQPGEPCVASCPGPSNSGDSFYATGGTCSTFDGVEVRASGEQTSFSCDVQTVSNEVRAQVYCLNYTLIRR